MKKYALISFVLLMASCGASIEKTANETQPESKWEYESSVDEMTGDTLYIAANKSTDQHNFQAPYNGGSKLVIGVMKKAKIKEIVIQVSKGQFVPSIMNEESIKFKFDDNQAFDVSYSIGKDGSLDGIYLTDIDTVLNCLKNAKKMKVEAPFSFEGKKVFNFDVSGLDFKQ